MARARKRRKVSAESTAAGESRTKQAPESSEAAERRCWFCSQPLTHGAMAPLAGLGSLEVHQRCYEEALKG